MSDKKKPDEFHSHNYSFRRNEYHGRPAPLDYLDEAIERAMREVPGAQAIIRRARKEPREAALIHYLIDKLNEAYKIAVDATLHMPTYSIARELRDESTRPSSNSPTAETEGEQLPTRTRDQGEIDPRVKEKTLPPYRGHPDGSE